MREKKSSEFSTFMTDSREKKTINQSNLIKRNQAFWKMAANNVKTAFVYPVGLTKTLSGI